MATSTINGFKKPYYQTTSAPGLLQEAYKHNNGRAPSNGEGGVFIVTVTDAELHSACWVMDFVRSTRLAARNTIFENGLSRGAANVQGTMYVDGGTAPYTYTIIQIGTY